MTIGWGAWQRLQERWDPAMPPRSRLASTTRGTSPRLGAESRTAGGLWLWQRQTGENASQMCRVIEARANWETGWRGWGWRRPPANVADRGRRRNEESLPKGSKSREWNQKERNREWNRKMQINKNTKKKRENINKQKNQTTYFRNAVWF